jgi:hypothetical protein
MVSAMRTGDHIRYIAGGRPDARVECSKPGAAQIVYDRPWRHPGLARTVIGQALFGGEMAEWRVVGRAA